METQGEQPKKRRGALERFIAVAQLRRWDRRRIGMSGTRLPPNLGAHSRRVTELFRPLPLAERLADSLILLLRYVDAAGIAAYATSSRSARYCLRLAPLLAYEAAARCTSVETPSTRMRRFRRRRGIGGARLRNRRGAPPAAVV